MRGSKAGSVVLLLGSTTFGRAAPLARAIRERIRQHRTERLEQIARKEEVSLSLDRGIRGMGSKHNVVESQEH